MFLKFLVYPAVKQLTKNSLRCHFAIHYIYKEREHISITEEHRKVFLSFLLFYSVSVQDMVLYAREQGF
jgi:hypothetical protein